MGRAIVVCLKQVPDNTKLRPEAVSGNALPSHGVEMMANPFDEYALETALRLKDAAGDGSTVTLLTIGHDSAKNVLKKAIAAGADDGFILNEEALLASDGAVVAHVLAKAVQTLVPQADIVLCGANALDTAASQTPAMLAEFLGWASLTNCKEVTANGGQLTAKRVSELGVETHELAAPAVFSLMKCDYELRASNIKGVMKANKTALPTKTVADLGRSLPASLTQSVSLAAQPAKGQGQRVDGTGTNVDTAVDALVAYLKEQKLA